VGKATLAPPVARDACVRSKFDYILYLVVGKGSTEAKVVADIADLVELSGGGAFAANITAVPAGEEQVQKDVI
jgi:hypothetical protein